MKVDTRLVAAGIAEVERMIEEEVDDPNGIGASTLRLVIDCVAGVIKADHPRFCVGEFQIESMPISNQRLKEVILAHLGEPRPIRGSGV